MLFIGCYNSIEEIIKPCLPFCFEFRNIGRDHCGHSRLYLLCAVVTNRLQITPEAINIPNIKLHISVG